MPRQILSGLALEDKNTEGEDVSWTKQHMKAILRLARPIVILSWCHGSYWWKETLIELGALSYSNWSQNRVLKTIWMGL